MAGIPPHKDEDDDAPFHLDEEEELFIDLDEDELFSDKPLETPPRTAPPRGVPPVDARQSIPSRPKIVFETAPDSAFDPDWTPEPPPAVVASAPGLVPGMPPPIAPPPAGPPTIAAVKVEGADDFRCLRCLKVGPPLSKPRAVGGGNAVYCAHCQNEIPVDYWQNWRETPTLQFSLVGLRGNGKTCFLQGLLQRFDSGLGMSWDDFNYRPVSVDDAATLRAWLTEIDEGVLPKPNQMQANTVALKLKGVPAIGELFLLMFDISGETFLQKRYLQMNADYVQRSRVLTLLVSLSDIRTSFELTSLLQLLEEGLVEVGAQPKEMSLVISLTKGDRHLPDVTLPPSAREALTTESACDPFDTGRLQTISSDLEEWIKAHPQNFRNFALNARDMFGDVQYTICSGTGFETSGQRQTYDRRPRNVVDPLLMLMQRSLPCATLTANGVCETFYSLEAAIDAANRLRTPAVIELTEGRFSVEGTLLLSGAITLTGQGADKTIVSGEGAKRLLCLRSPEAVVEGIGFVHRGKQPASVAAVQGGKFRFKSCSFRGGIHEPVTKLYGHGLEIGGDARGVVSECDSSMNEGSGFRAAGTSQVRLERNKCHENRMGISVSKNSRTNLANNSCSRNDNGIGLFEDAVAEVSSNVCNNNRKYGIIDRSRAASQIIQNACTNESGEPRQEVGIGIQGSAHPKVVGNVCNHNVKDGLQVSGQSRPELTGNTATKNGRYGICVFETAQPTVQNSTCEQNDFGIYVGSKIPRAASIKKKSNKCANNRKADFTDNRPGIW